MDLATGIWVGAALFLVILVPYLVWEIRRGKAHGHTWFTWFKPRGHSDVGPEVGGIRLWISPGVDEACGTKRGYSALKGRRTGRPAAAGSVFLQPSVTNDDLSANAHRRVGKE